MNSGVFKTNFGQHTFNLISRNGSLKSVKTKDESLIVIGLQLVANVNTLLSMAENF